MNEFSRNCPNCGKVKLYKTKAHLQRAIKNNSLCLSCFAKQRGKNPAYTERLSKAVTNSWKELDRKEKSTKGIKKFWSELSMEDLNIIKNNMSKSYKKSNERAEKNRIATIKQFEDKEFYAKWYKSITTPESRESRKNCLINQLNDPLSKIHSKESKAKKAEQYRKAWNSNPVWRRQALYNLGHSFSNMGKGTSKLEKYVFSKIKHLGFKHKATICGYCVDIVHVSLPIIIEVNGDFWHANPQTYKPEWINKVTGKTAKDIWFADAKRIKILEDAGYKVIVIWQKDIKNKKFNIENYALKHCNLIYPPY